MIWPKLLLSLAVLALYLLHQDFWFWRDGRLVYGVLPVGLFYHVLYAVACSVLMWALVKFAWPARFDDSATDQPPATNHQQPS